MSRHAVGSHRAVQSPESADVDVAVLGAGPAGLALATALLARGVRVAVVAPELGAPHARGCPHAPAGPRALSDALRPATDRPPPAWRPTYCAWADELAEVGFADVAADTWAGAVATFGDERRHDLDRAYVRVDNARLAARLWRDDLLVVRGVASAAEHGGTSTRVTLADAAGRPWGALRATLVVDATGHRASLVPAPARPAPAFQTAVGRFLDTRDTPWPRDRVVLMDYTPAAGAAPSAGAAAAAGWGLAADPAARAGSAAACDPVAPPRGDPTDAPPSFLYVLPGADGRVFVEETVLAARPAVPAAVLRARLRRRLSAYGIDPGAADPPGSPGPADPPGPAHAARTPDEWVHIPMGGALPQPGRVLPLGAAAGMVHPATGYLLPRVLGAANPVADAIVSALATAGPDEAVAAAWATIWPISRRRTRALHRFGLEALLGMDGPATRDFFDAFFRRPTADWSGYLSDRLGPVALSGVMTRLFAEVPPPMKRRLARAGLGPEGLALARAMLG